MNKSRQRYFSFVVQETGTLSTSVWCLSLYESLAKSTVHHLPEKNRTEHFFGAISNKVLKFMKQRAERKAERRGRAQPCVHRAGMLI